MDDEERAILREIRDISREHLEEYKRAAARSIATQEKVARLYVRVVAVAAVVVASGILFIAYALFR